MRLFLLTTILLLTTVSTGLAAGGPLHVWSDVYGGGDIANAGQIAVDSAGNLFMVGGFTHFIDLGGGPLTGAGSNDIFLARFDADGNHVWSQAFGGSALDIGTAIGILSDGTLIVAGSHNSTIDLGGGPLVTAGGQNAFLACFDPDGSHVWSRTWGGTGSTSIKDLAITSGDNVVLIGGFTSSVDFGGGLRTSAGGSDLYVMLYKSTGSISWDLTYGNAENQYSGGIVVDQNDDIYFTASTHGDLDLGGGLHINQGGTDIVFASVDDGTGFRWAHLLGGAGWDGEPRIACDGTRIYLSGTFGDTIDLGPTQFTAVGSSDLFLAAYNAGGNHVWSSQFGDGASLSFKSLEVDPVAGILGTGNIYGAADFGGGPVSAGGASDVLAVRFETDGTHLWSGAWGDANYDVANHGLVDEDGVYLHGEFDVSLDFGGGPLIDTNYYRSIFCARLDDPAPATDLLIEDVGNDQGRQVRLTFEASLMDAAGSTLPVTQYDLYRRIDPLPGEKLGGWDFLGVVPARGEDEYSLVLPTLADSTIADGQYWSVFMVRAMTADLYTFWDSSPDSGYSLDNLAPGVPTGLLLDIADLSWNEAPEADFDYYTVYTSPTSDFTTATPLGNTTGTSFDVTGTGGLYLAVAAVDFSGNVSDLSAPSLNLSDVPDVADRTVLHPNVPNPFNPSTVIRFELREAGFATLTVHDVSGRLVQTLVAGDMAAGPHEMTWNGADVHGRQMPSAVYFYRLECGDHIETRRMTLLK